MSEIFDFYKTNKTTLTILTWKTVLFNSVQEFIEIELGCF